MTIYNENLSQPDETASPWARGEPSPKTSAFGIGLDISTGEKILKHQDMSISQDPEISSIKKKFNLFKNIENLRAMRDE